MKYCLVVDDSAVIRKVARRILEGLQFRIAEAEDGARAIDSCRGEMPDAVLLDWNMPIMDGLSFLKALREQPNAKQPTVVMCTTENDMSRIVEAMQAGANEYIMKPFTEEIMRDKLEETGVL